VGPSTRTAVSRRSAPGSVLTWPRRACFTRRGTRHRLGEQAPGSCAAMQHAGGWCQLREGRVEATATGWCVCCPPKHRANHGGDGGMRGAQPPSAWHCQQQRWLTRQAMPGVRALPHLLVRRCSKQKHSALERTRAFSRLRRDMQHNDGSVIRQPRYCATRRLAGPSRHRRQQQSATAHGSPHAYLAHSVPRLRRLRCCGPGRRWANNAEARPADR
jgi:hypothetical protein